MSNSEQQKSHNKGAKFSKAGDQVSTVNRPRRKADSVVKGTMHRWDGTDYAEFHPVVGKGEPTREMLKQIGNSTLCKNLGKKESSYSLHLNIDGESVDPVAEMEELFHLLTADQRKQAPQLVEGSQGRMLYDNGQNLQIWLDSEKQEVSIMARLNCSNQIDRDLLQAQSAMNVTIGRYRNELLNHQSNNNK